MLSGGDVTASEHTPIFAPLSSLVADWENTLTTFFPPDVDDAKADVIDSPRGEGEEESPEEPQKEEKTRFPVTGGAHRAPFLTDRGGQTPDIFPFRDWRE